MKTKPLTEQEQLFVTTYVACFNAARSARVAGYANDANSVGRARAGWGLLRRPDIKTAIEEGVAARLAHANMVADEVLGRWVLIATADPNELIQHRRVCCRYCWGKDGKYQRTESEFNHDLAAKQREIRAHEKLGEAAVLGGLEPPDPFDPAGGTGYDATREPHADCIECFGEGISQVYVTDTRDLSPAAAALLAGVKQTKDGIEVKMHSQEKAWELLGKHLGVVKEKIEVEGDIGLVERLRRGRERARGLTTQKLDDDAEALAG
jgi:phage terminase small subunit